MGLEQLAMFLREILLSLMSQTFSLMILNDIAALSLTIIYIVYFVIYIVSFVSEFVSTHTTNGDLCQIHAKISTKM